MLILVAAMEKCKQGNEFKQCHYGQSLFIHELKLSRSAIQGILTLMC